MHFLNLNFHDSLGSPGFKITLYCEWVGRSHFEELAVFSDYKEALQYAKEKSHELGLKLVDYVGKILEEEKQGKEKKGG